MHEFYTDKLFASDVPHVRGFGWCMCLGLLRQYSYLFDYSFGSQQARKGCIWMVGLAKILPEIKEIYCVFMGNGIPWACGFLL